MDKMADCWAHIASYLMANSKKRKYVQRRLNEA
jgi:hypothetical protein